MNKQKQNQKKTVELITKKQMATFSFSPPVISGAEGKWLLAVISFEANNSVFKITDENKSFSITTPSLWSSKGGAETTNEPQKLLEKRRNNVIGLHVGGVRKRRNQMKTGDKEYKLSDLD